MTASLVVEILLGLMAAGVTSAAFFAATRANRAQSQSTQVSVDAAAYTRAKEIYEGALGTLRTEVESMRLEVTRLRESNDRLREEIAGLRQELGRH
jgi:chromosome segregation ATPase